MEKMSQPLGKLGLVATIIGVTALLLWGQNEVSWLLTTALLAGGLGLLAGAVEIVLAQRAQPLQGVGRLYEGLGPTLYPWSFFLLIVGLGLVTTGLLRLLGLTDAFGNFLARRPGPALLLGGLIVGAAGVATVIGPATWHENKLLDFLGKLPARFFGMLLVIFSLAALILGTFELISPAGFDRWLAAVLGPFAP